MSILQLLLAFLLILWTLYVLYYYILLIASALKIREQEAPEGANQKLRFALLVPAHNEEMVIGKTVRKMKKLNYDKDLFDVVVIARQPICDASYAQIEQALQHLLKKSKLIV